MDWNIKVSDSWIQIDKVKGSTVCEERIWVSVDWSKVPVGDRVTGIIEVTTKNDKKENIYVSVFNPSSPSLAEMSTLFVEHNGYVSINKCR